MADQPRRVVVTGGSGLAGRAVVADLVDHGYAVTNVDLVPQEGAAPFRRADLTDLGQVYGALRGADAVVHFGAIPRPTFDTPDVVFRTNVMGSFNVFEAANALGISRIVYASSVSVIGYPFHEKPFDPEYFPIDEAHPRQPQDAYALSKTIGEDLAAGFARRGHLSVVSLRLAWIHTPRTFAAQLQPMWNDPAAGASNLWSYIDTRDVGEAVRLSLAAEIEGHAAAFVAAPDTFMPIPSRDLAATYYPSVPLRDQFGNYDSFFDSTSAERLLGFRAKHSWRDDGLTGAVPGGEL
ncbi:MAG: NAD(P)-dependent oxidoreductase [Thermomicrobiales bacterium]